MLVVAPFLREGYFLSFQSGAALLIDALFENGLTPSTALTAQQILHSVRPSLRYVFKDLWIVTIFSGVGAGAESIPARPIQNP
jgi:hypothetical protein